MNARDAQTTSNPIPHSIRLLRAGLGSILAQATWLRDVHDSTENHTAESKKLTEDRNLPSRGRVQRQIFSCRYDNSTVALAGFDGHIASAIFQTDTVLLRP